MKVYQDIEVVQLNLDPTTDRYYFPENTRILGKHINDVSIFAAKEPKVQSPFDGKEVIQENLLNQFYIEIVKDTKDVLHHNVNAAMANIGINNRLMVNSNVDMALSNIQYTGDTKDLTDKCILLYFTYNTIVDDDFEHIYKQVAVNIYSKESRIKLSDFIDDFIIAQQETVKCVEFTYNQAEQVPFYLDLRDYSGRVFSNVPSVRLQSTQTVPTGSNVNLNKCYLLDYNIDFKNSYIVSAKPGKQLNITLILSY